MPVTPRLLTPPCDGKLRSANLWANFTSIISGSQYLYIQKTIIWVFPKNNGTPKSSILIGFSIINHPFWGTPIFETPIYTYTSEVSQLAPGKWWLEVKFPFLGWPIFRGNVKPPGMGAGDLETWSCSTMSTREDLKQNLAGSKNSDPPKSSKHEHNTYSFQ